MSVKQPFADRSEKRVGRISGELEGGVKVAGGDGVKAAGSRSGMGAPDRPHHHAIRSITTVMAVRSATRIGHMIGPPLRK